MDIGIVTHAFILSQILGALGYVFFISSTQFKNRTSLLLVEATGCALIAMHWFILAQSVGLAMNIAFGLVCLMGIVRARHRLGNHLYLLVFPIVLSAVVLGWDGTWISYLSIAAAVLFISARFCKNLLRLRSIAICATSCWVVMNLFMGSYIGVLCNVLFITGHAKQIFRILKSSETKDVLQTA